MSNNFIKNTILSLIYFLLEEKKILCILHDNHLFYFIFLNFNIKQQIVKNCISHLQMGRVARNCDRLDDWSLRLLGKTSLQDKFPTCQHYC